MSKWLTVVALVLLVLSGAVGLRNMVAASAPTISASSGVAPGIWANGPGPIPKLHGGHEIANGPGPIPKLRDGHVIGNGPGPIPKLGGGGH